MDYKPWEQNWAFVQVLGGGGQGETSIVANRQDSKIRGVLKILREEKQHNPKARRRMFQEVTNLRVLHGAGANVPQVYEDNTSSFEGDEYLFFVMQLIEGKPLADVVTEESLDVVTAVQVVQQLCNTLRYAVKEKSFTET
jgi:serine/threonine protein kinase